VRGLEDRLRLKTDPSATLYATHGLQSYAAKCPPHFVRYGLRYYSKANEVVLDSILAIDPTPSQLRMVEWGVTWIWRCCRAR